MKVLWSYPQVSRVRTHKTVLRPACLCTHRNTTSHNLLQVVFPHYASKREYVPLWNLVVTLGACLLYNNHLEWPQSTAGQSKLTQRTTLWNNYNILCIYHGQNVCPSSLHKALMILLEVQCFSISMTAHYYYNTIWILAHTFKNKEATWHDGLLTVVCSEAPTSTSIISVFSYNVTTGCISSILLLNTSLVACRGKRHDGRQQVMTTI